MTATATPSAPTFADFNVGDGATSCRWSDREAGTILSRTATTIVWQRDTAELLNGPDSGEEDALTFTPGGFMGHTSGTQRHAYTADPEGMIEKFTLRKNGHWHRAGTATGSRGSRLIAGRHEFRDFNF